MKNKFITLGIITSFFTITSFSDNTPATADNQNSAALLLQPSYKTASAYCPDASKLSRNASGYWYFLDQALGKWKSTDWSFATDVTGFLGAQWTGAEVGKIFCLYASEQRYQEDGAQQIQKTFPIILSCETIALQPKPDNHWKIAANGVINCVSATIDDCAFVVRLNPTQPVDPDQILQAIKPAGPDDSN